MEKVIAVALITEALWETFKMVWNQKKISYDRIGAIVVGIVIAFAAGVDIFKIVGIPLSVEYLGEILTGILISRGANFMHDIMGNIDKSYQTKKSG